MKRIFLPLLLLLVALHVSAYQKQSIDINVNGQQRNMVVFTPNSLPVNSPLFIVTHGMNQDPEYQYGSDKLYEMIDTAKFVVAYLRSDGSTWDTGGTKDQNFVTKTIDEMYNRFEIDKNRVYWSGFSMGSMLIHHCISKMQSKIAAFAPTSGIQFSESPWNNCTKPVNLLECIAYGDDVFGYEQYGIHAYIENYAKHDKHTCYSKTVYQPGWYDGDLEKWTGGPNGGEVWLFSYNNGGHWPMTDNRKLIWNFCKRFSLGQPFARFTKPAGETTNLCFSPKDSLLFPDIDLAATAKATAANTQVASLEFFDGKSRIDSLVATPFAAQITDPKSGKHNLQAKVTDSNGKTYVASCLVNNVSVQTSYSLVQRFKVENCVPQDWYVCNGSSKRIGGGLSYTSGPRILKFTNSSRSFQYGLLVQNASGREKAAWAKFGTAEGRSSLRLSAGHYVVRFKVCNWNRPEFSPVTVAIENLDGEAIAQTTYTPTINIGNNVANKFSGAVLQSYEFDVPQTGNYVVAIYADAERNADFVLGTLNIQALTFGPTGITDVTAEQRRSSSQVYDLSGRRINDAQLKSGLYIIDGRKTVVK